MTRSTATVETDKETNYLGPLVDFWRRRDGRVHETDFYDRVEADWARSLIASNWYQS
jgi:hypothetical protein